MILPVLKNIQTLIFDMDGTLIRSEKMAKNALRNALKNYFQTKAEPAPEYTDKELMSGVGAPSNEFYISLLPGKYKPDWENFRDLVFTEESTFLQNHRVTYPGAISTLKELKNRGYTLALVSNCSRDYFDQVMDTQNVRKYFDFAMCIGDEDGITKKEIFKRILKQSDKKAAVIGDRFYDVEAATANGLPTVGALYGYGTRAELADTVTWVEDIRHLLRYFDPFYEICESLARYLISRRTSEHPLVVAIDTPHSSAAGKFVKNLCDSISEFGSFSTMLDLDRLQTSNQIKTSKLDPNSMYQWQMIKKQLEEIRDRGSVNVSFPSDGKGSAHQVLRARGGSIVLIIGTGLTTHNNENLFDITINFQVKHRTAVKSYKQNAEDFPDTDIVDRLKLWKTYLNTLSPENKADFVLKDFKVSKGRDRLDG